MIEVRYFAWVRDRIGLPRDKITTEIKTGQTFYFAEAAHQQYLAKNPGGYCNLRGTGVSCPIPQRAAV